MSGDADHYETVKEIFDTEEEFEKAYDTIEAWLNFKFKYHNAACEITRNRGLEQLAKYPEVYKAVQDLLKGKSYSEMFEDVGLDVQYDITCEGFPAWLDNIHEIYHYDEHGDKFNVTVK